MRGGGDRFDRIGSPKNKLAAIGLKIVPWSIEDVEKNLLGQKASAIALPTDLITDAINRVERILGYKWIVGGTKATGVFPAMTIIGMGLQLAAIEEDLDNSERLISKLRNRDQNAEAELTAIYVIRDQDSSVQLELEPLIGTRKADFRIRKAGESWTTVEVTQAMTSKNQKHLLDVLHKILDALKASRSAFSLDVILRRPPTEGETQVLASELPTFCAQSGQQELALRDELGVLFLNHTPINQGGTIEIPGLGPTIGIVVCWSGAGWWTSSQGLRSNPVHR